MITNALDNLTRNELRSIAIKNNVPRGRSGKDTKANLSKAIAAKKLRLSVTVTIRPNTNPDARFVPASFSKKYRTHKPNKVIVPA